LLMLLTLSALLVLLVMVDSSTEPVTHKADDAAPKSSRKPLEEEKPLTTTAKRRGRRRRFADRWQPTTGGSAQSPPYPQNATIAPAEALATIDPTCHGEAHRGYAGDGAVVWGLNFKLPSAAECCAACKAHAAVCSSPDSQGKSWWPSKPDMRCPRHHNPVRVCQIWTWCPEERCFAFDIHVHTFGECWLKFQDVDPTRPKDPHFGHTSYPEAMRRAPRKLWPWAVKEEIWPGEMPQRVPWTSGVIAPAGTVIVSSEPNDRWRERWCSKHGPC